MIIGLWRREHGSVEQALFERTPRTEFSGTGSKAIKGYMDRVFSRDSFLQSVGEAAPKNLMDDK